MRDACLVCLLVAGPSCAVLAAACATDAPPPIELKDDPDETGVTTDIVCPSVDYGSACAQRCDNEGAPACLAGMKHPYNHKAGVGLLSGCGGFGGVPTECRFYFVTTGGSCVVRLGRSAVCSP